MVEYESNLFDKQEDKIEPVVTVKHVLDTFKPCDSISAGPVVANDIVYFGANNGYIHAVDANSGELIWKNRTGGVIIASSVVHNGILYIGSFDQYFYAMDAKTGEILWKFRTNERLAAGSTVTDDCIYLGSVDSYLYCLSHAGELLWKFYIGGEIDAPMHINNGILYFGSWDGLFRAFDLEERKVLWEFKVGSATSKPMYNSLLNRAWNVARMIRNMFWKPDPKTKGSIYEKEHAIQNSNTYSIRNPYEMKETSYTQKTEYGMKRKKDEQR